MQWGKSQLAALPSNKALCRKTRFCVYFKLQAGAHIWMLHWCHLCLCSLINNRWEPLTTRGWIDCMIIWRAIIDEGATRVNYHAKKSRANNRIVLWYESPNSWEHYLNPLHRHLENAKPKKPSFVNKLTWPQYRLSTADYTITAQVILAFWLVLVYDLLEDKCTIDV